MRLRPAELRGSWYPASRDECERFFEQAGEPPGTIDRGAAPDGELGRPVGAIVPHAGWIYSGAVAYGALARVAAAQPDPDLVIVFGGHLVARDLPRIFIEGGFETPYGDLEIATDVAADLSMLVESDLETPDEYYEDNAIEVLLPMLKKLWPKARALAVGAPPIARATDLGGEVVDRARDRGFSKMIVIGSTDLTHYGPNYAFSPNGRGEKGLAWVKTKNDPELIAKMAALDPEGVLWTAARSKNACCPGAVAAAITAGRKLGATKAEVTRYTTSWDANPQGPEPTSFVGYAGMVLS